MKRSNFTAKLTAMPHKQAKRMMCIARIMIVALFITIMTSTAVVAWLLFTSSNKLPFATALILLGVASFFGGRLHGEIHEAARLMASEAPTFNFNIPLKALVAVPYSPETSIRELANCLMNGKPFWGSICYQGGAIPNDSVHIAFLNQQCLDVSEQLDRITSAAKAGAKIILIAHMAEGLSPDAEASLRSSVKQLCSDLDVTVINEEYNRSALRYYEYSIDLRHATS